MSKHFFVKNDCSVLLTFSLSHNHKLHGHDRGEPFHHGGVSATGKVTVFLLEVGFSLPSAQHSAQSALCVLHTLCTCYRKPGLAGPLLW